MKILIIVNQIAFYLLLNGYDQSLIDLSVPIEYESSALFKVYGTKKKKNTG